MTPFRSLRALTAAFLLAFVAATALTGIAVYSASQGIVTDLVDRRIASVSGELAELASHADTALLVRQIEALGRQRDTGDLGLILTTANGRVLAANVRPGKPLPGGFSTVDAAHGIKGLSSGRALVRPLGDGLILTVIAETEPVDDYAAARARIYLFGFGSIILVVVGGVITFGFVIGRRIVAMRRTVEAIMDGDMARRVPVDGSDSAFDQQARAFNAMLDRIAALMVEISNVSNDLAHDLRTPLARLRARLQALAQASAGGPDRAGIDAAIADSDALLAMFAAILRIAEIEGGKRRAGFARLDLGAIAHHVATTMQPVAAEAGQRLDEVERRRLPVLGDRQLLVQALINLVENAIRHAGEGAHIRIETAIAARGDDRWAIVSIIDDGPGIPAGARGQAMRRFGRLDDSRGGGGHGLGLPLVESIARLHRGTLTLGDAAPGLHVAMGLPLAA